MAASFYADDRGRMAAVAISRFLACFSKKPLPREQWLPAISVVMGAGVEIEFGVDGTCFLAYTPRERVRSNAKPDGVSLLIGDTPDYSDNLQERFFGNAASIEFSSEAQQLTGFSSLGGLPALFLLEQPSLVCLASEIRLFAGLPELSLEFSPEGILDQMRFAHPVSDQTLFKHVSLVPAGTNFQIRNDLKLRTLSKWDPPVKTPFGDWSAYTKNQMEVFERAISAIDYSDSILSMTAGLDTRTIFAYFVSQSHRVPALTVCGPNDSLDAVIARALCEAYGVPHETIRLDRSFLERLPELTEKGSLLSGGIGSVKHAPQVYCYESVAGSARGMISGYLGNQVGRLGMEGLGYRKEVSPLLSREFQEIDRSRPHDPWYEEGVTGDVHQRLDFLIRKESMFGNLSSYMVGHSFWPQQSPYASRELIENLYRMPGKSETGESTGGQFRRASVLTDLRNRFFGPDQERSFQRQFISRFRGAISEYPVNWGWRPRGGISPSGAVRGIGALIDGFLSPRLAKLRLDRPLALLGIAGLHEFHPIEDWLQNSLTEFTADILRSAGTRSTGIFDTARLEEAIDAFHRKRQPAGDLVFALDVALAAKHFCGAEN
jgi:hypothetical protein